MRPIHKHILLMYVRGVAIGVGFSLCFLLAFQLRPLPILIAALIFGVPIGLVFPFVASSVIPRIRFRSFLLTAVAMAGVIMLALMVSLLVSVAVYVAFAERAPLTNPAVLDTIRRMAWSWQLGVSSLIGFGLVLIVMGVVEISRKLGPGVLLRWVTGRYYTPREEERIFMFLDMKDSTMLAERLGALRFSSLVRDFFDDLTEPVLNCEAEVSHYIGDEAVLTWPLEKGLAGGRCLRLFALFDARLKARAGHYQSKYGLVPGFKAGAHCGPVVATEVGQVKSEIVYHGDVLNTTARITGMCGPLGEDLLVSEDLAARLPAVPLRSLGRVELKGKERPMELFAPVRT